MKQINCPYFVRMGGTQYCMNGKFPIDCYKCDCPDKKEIEVTITTSPTSDYKNTNIPQKDFAPIPPQNIEPLYEREEERKQAAKDYADSIAQHEHNKLFSIADFMAGAKWADKTMKNKIYEWLEKHARNYFDECDFYCFKCDRMIEGFKKAMEEEQ